MDKNSIRRERAKDKVRREFDLLVKNGTLFSEYRAAARHLRTDELPHMLLQAHVQGSFSAKILVTDSRVLVFSTGFHLGEVDVERSFDIREAKSAVAEKTGGKYANMEVLLAGENKLGIRKLPASIAEHLVSFLDLPDEDRTLMAAQLLETRVTPAPPRPLRDEREEGTRATVAPSKRREDVSGLIESYGVVYLGGLPDYPKRKVGKIDLRVFEDRFELLPTTATEKWLKDLTIPYSQVLDVSIVQRQVSTVEGLLGGLDSRQLNQANNIHINYETDGGDKLVLRLEMLTGFTVMGQAMKCREFKDRLTTHGIRDRFRRVQGEGHKERSDVDIPSQIEKLAALRDKGIITQDEFATKKTELLSRL